MGFYTDVFQEMEYFEFSEMIWCSSDLAMFVAGCSFDTGAWIVYSSNALDYIGEHIKVAKKTYERYDNEWTKLDLFGEPEKFTCYMLLYGVSELVSRWCERYNGARDVFTIVDNDRFLDEIGLIVYELDLA